MISGVKNVLVVDDHIENQIVLKQILDSIDVSYDSAINGEEALDFIENKKYAVILMDVQMPGKNGFEVLETMNGNGNFNQSPVIFITGTEIGKEAFDRGYSNGGSDYMVKPVNPKAVIQKVKTFCDLFDLKNNTSTTITNEFEKVLNSINMEIQTPAKGIMNNVRKLLKNDDFSPAHKKLLTKIAVSGNNLIELTNRLSDFSSTTEHKNLIEGEIITQKNNLKFDINVLVVEDQIVDQEASTIILESFGCSVTKASNGVEALFKMANQVFDLVLIDLELPVMNGFETVKNMKLNCSVLPKIYAVTANTLIAKEDIYFEKGFTKHILKPLNKNDFLNQIFKDFKHKIVKG